MSTCEYGGTTNLDKKEHGKACVLPTGFYARSLVRNASIRENAKNKQDTGAAPTTKVLSPEAENSSKVIKIVAQV